MANNATNLRAWKTVFYVDFKGMSITKYDVHKTTHKDYYYLQGRMIRIQDKGYVFVDDFETSKRTLIAKLLSEISQAKDKIKTLEIRIEEIKKINN
jgi:prephenate dehydratase